MYVSYCMSVVIYTYTYHVCILLHGGGSITHTRISLVRISLSARPLFRKEVNDIAMLFNAQHRPDSINTTRGRHHFKLLESISFILVKIPSQS